MNSDNRDVNTTNNDTTISYTKKINNENNTHTIDEMDLCLDIINVSGCDATNKYLDRVTDIPTIDDIDTDTGSKDTDEEDTDIDDENIDNYLPDYNHENYFGTIPLPNPDNSHNKKCQIELFRLSKERTSETTCFSYGKIRGNFNLSSDILITSTADPYICSNYAIVEKKTEFYKLMFDFDFKGSITTSTNGKEKEIVLHITGIIIVILQTYIINPNTKYLYCDKNIGEGVHLYFPDIFVNKHFHNFIAEKVMTRLIDNNPFNFDKDTLTKIFDPCVAKANGLRLPYYSITDKDTGESKYYKPNITLSTYQINNNRKMATELCLIRSSKSSFNFKFVIDNSNMSLYSLESAKTKNTAINKKLTTNNKAVIELDADVINEIECLDVGDKKELIISLLDILNVKRIDNYSSWINLIYICKNYNLYNEIINISKKSPKFDNKSLSTINNIFNKKGIPDVHFTIGTLYKWSKEDNYIAYLNIMRANNITVKMEIMNSSDFLSHGSDITHDYVENNKYVSDTAIKHMLTSMTDDHTRVFVLEAGTGVGKTTAATKLIDGYLGYMLQPSEYVSMVSIVSRRSMSATHINVFKKFEFKSYLDHNTPTNRYIASLERLSRNDMKYSCDILILDEINSLLRYFYSDTMDNKRHKALVNLCCMIRSASFVVMMDANVTSMVHQFLKVKPVICNSPYFYKNTIQNKKDVGMAIYTSPTINDNAKLKEFAKFIYDDITAKKSVLILCDSKRIVTLIHSVLSNIQPDQTYYKLFTKDEGSLDDIINCNITFVNKCVIASPKIIYGVDITIPYDTVFCIYKYTGNSKGMGSLEYYQQVGRPRNCKNVKLLIMDPYYNKTDNYYITFDENKKMVDNEFNKLFTRHGEYCVDNKIADELCTSLDICGNLINRESVFAGTHYYKTWFDKLFSRNKLQLFEILSREAGYNVSKITLKITEDNSGFIGVLKKYNDRKLNILHRLLNYEQPSDCDKSMADNLKEDLMAKLRSINLDINDIPDTCKPLLISQDKYDAHINSRYLNMTKNEYKKWIIKVNNAEIPQMLGSNKLAKRIDALFWLEEYFKIKRYAVDSIKLTKNNTLDKYKKDMVANIKYIADFFDGMQGRNTLENRMVKNINNIEYLDQLKKLVAECYNSFGNLITWNSKATDVTINGNRIRRQFFSNFKKVA